MSQGSQSEEALKEAFKAGHTVVIEREAYKIKMTIKLKGGGSSSMGGGWCSSTCRVAPYQVVGLEHDEHQPVATLHLHLVPALARVVSCGRA